ncbi:MAG: NAD(P)-dependent oxidoreductase [Clostridia bacterium]|nr:NAD(P)-dependent oxidoreductase [Clostridia bacterium]
MEQLVGYTGFVGSNLQKAHIFDGLYDSKNVSDAYGKNPDLLVYSGVPAQKFLANKEPEKDFEIIKNAINNINRINPKEIVLISTIDVYKNPVGVDEDTRIDTENLQPYGYNRYYLEKWVSENIENHLIVHLPGLYGDNIKKNFIYDLINFIPSMLKKEKFDELVQKDDFINNFYELQENGFYKIKALDKAEKEKLKEYFRKIGFSALNFTDSRAKFQFYNLKYLWEHIEIARKQKLKVLNLATEPVSIAEIHKFIEEKEFINEITQDIPNYDFKTKYDDLFNGKNGYIFNKEFILNDIKQFVLESKEK